MYASFGSSFGINLKFEYINPRIYTRTFFIYSKISISDMYEGKFITDRSMFHINEYMTSLYVYQLILLW